MLFIGAVFIILYDALRIMSDVRIFLYMHRKFTDFKSFNLFAGIELAGSSDKIAVLCRHL